jgi:hypothetical protein
MGFESHFSILFFKQNFVQYPWCFSAEMDSTHFKDFRDTKFAIFGQVVYFISNLQDLHKIWNLKFKFEIRFWPVDWGGWLAAMWQHGIGWYRFGLGLLIWAAGSRSKGQKRKGRERAHRREDSGEGDTGVRRRWSSGGLRLWGSSGRCADRDSDLEFLIGDDVCFPRRCRGAAGGDGGFGQRLGAWFAAVLSKRRAWEDARGRGKEIETRRRTRGLRGAPKFNLRAQQHDEVRWSIATDWRGSVNGEKEGPVEGSAGFDGEGLKGRGSYWRGSNRWPFPLPGGREREIREKKEPTGGTHLAAREREERGWAGFPGWLGWSWAPGTVQVGWPLLLLFLFCFLFFLFLISVLDFEKAIQVWFE